MIRVNNFTLNDSNLVIGALRLVSISGGSTTTAPSVVNMTVAAGTFIFASTFSTFNISGNLNVTGGNFYIGNLSSQVVTVTGDLNLSNGILGMLNYITTSNNASLSVNNFIQTGGTFNLNLYNGTAGAGGTSTFSVAGNFNKSNGIFTQNAADSGIIVMNGTASQTFNIGSNGYMNNITTLQINNTGSTGNNTVTLNSSVTNISNIQLTNGLLALGINSLNVNYVNGGSATTYIDASGTGRLTLNTVSSSATLIPLGASWSYLPITFIGTTNQPNLTIGINTTFTRTPAIAANVVNAQWTITASSACNSTVQFQFNSGNKASSYSTISSQILGIYASSAYSETPCNAVSGSNPYTVSTSSAINLPTTSSLFEIGRAHV